MSSFIEKFKTFFPKQQPYNLYEYEEDTEEFGDFLKEINSNNYVDLIECGIYSTELLNSLTKEALIYYIPVFIEYVLTEIESNEYIITIGLISFFKDLEEKIFSNSQTNAIIDFLILLNKKSSKHLLDYDDVENLQLAIENLRKLNSI